MSADIAALLPLPALAVGALVLLALLGVAVGGDRR